jgi:membrane protease YdiL (CAAX protease family)
VPEIARPVAEALVTIVLVIAIAAWLVWGKSGFDALTTGDGLAHQAWVTLGKLIVFVALPYLVFHFAFGHRLGDFGLSREAWRRLAGRDGLAAGLIGIAICVFQFYAGNAAAPIRNGEIAGPALWFGVPFSFAWLMIEAGLVEEFFFRGIVQTRLAALFKSEVAGLFVMALIFGLIHAPGIVLRGAGGAEGLSASPGVAEAMAYTVVTQAVGAFYLGIVWMRTRSLPAVMIVHAATDLLPATPGLVKALGL